MQLKHDWRQALESARRGDLSAALAAREDETDSVLEVYFFGRCLAEAPPSPLDSAGATDYDEAVRLLTASVQAEPANPVFLQTLALALARTGSPQLKRQAAGLWRSHGLPQDLDLLAQVALTLEGQLRPLPELSDEPDWPAGLERPPDSPPDSPSNPPPTEPEIPAEPVPQGDNLAQPGESCEPTGEPSAASVVATVQPPKVKNPRLSRHAARELGRLEELLLKYRPREVLEGTSRLLASAEGSAEVHLLAGVAAEEAGLALLARAHLARSARLEPNMLMSRAHLGRVYWRLGWFELAVSLWRSLPVEGPYDYGRHYHLALGHWSLGQPAAAVAAMRLALRDFFYDIRHFYIKRALERWLAAVDRPDSK